MSTTVVNIHETNDWDVKIDRTTIFGNPYHVDIGRLRCIELFKRYFLKRVSEDLEFREKVLQLQDQTLGCHCKPLACHGDVIADWLNNQ